MVVIMVNTRSIAANRFALCANWFNIFIPPFQDFGRLCLVPVGVLRLGALFFRVAPGDIQPRAPGLFEPILPQLFTYTLYINAENPQCQEGFQKYKTLLSNIVLNLNIPHSRHCLRTHRTVLSHGESHKNTGCECLKRRRQTCHRIARRA